MTYPPPIAYADFPSIATPPSLGVITNCSQQKCKIKDLWLGPDRRGDPFTKTHEPIHAGRPGRYCFAPGPQNQDMVEFELDNGDLVEAATIAVYRRGKPMAPWTMELTPEDLAKKKYPLMKLFEGAADSPNVVEAPYRLDLIIKPKQGATAEVSTAWIYLDVVAKEIVLSIGKEQDAKTKELLESVDKSLKDSTVSSKLLLTCNRFAKNAAERTIVSNSDTMEWNGEDYAFLHYLEVWDDGPELPLLAEIQVEDSSGKAVASPLATKGAVIVWDAQDAVAEAPDPLAGAQGDDAQVIREYLARYEALKKNCPSEHGGKRGASDKPILAGQIKCQVESLGFKVEACKMREGSCFSEVLENGKAGVYFLPSRMAGDAYRLRANFLYDTKENGAPLLDVSKQAPEPTLQSITGILQVWRQIDIVERLSLVLVALQAQNRKALEEAEAHLAELRKQRQSSADGVDDWPKDQDAQDKYEGIWPDSSFVARAIKGYETAKAARCAKPDDAWRGNLDNIRKRLGRAHVHVEANGELKEESLSEYHEMVRKVSFAKREMVALALDLTAESWTNGSHALQFVDHGAFYKKCTEKFGKDKGDEAIKKYFGPHAPGLPPEDSQCTLTKECADFSGVFKKLYDESCHNWAKKILEEVIDEAIPAGGKDGIYIFEFSELCQIGDQMDSSATGYALPLPHKRGTKTAYVVFENPEDSTAAHEIGHCLFLVHAPGGHEVNVDPHAHDTKMKNCLMGYHENANDFCGFCILRLRGWDRKGLRP